MGLNQTGMETQTIWHAEIEPAAASIFEKQHPGSPNLGDITAVKWEAVETPHILTAGFPCQPVSTAGRQLAHNDARWLWPAVHAAILALRPPTVFLENVQNITSIHRGAIHTTILDDLRAAGYAARWAILGACRVGGCHHRHRWFLRAEHLRQVEGPEPVRVATLACGAPRRGGRLLLPSPRGSDHQRGIEPNRAGRTGTGGTLGDAVGSLLPTPAARDHKGCDMPGREGGMGLPTAIAMLPTPRATDHGSPNKRAAPGWRPTLGQAAVTLLPQHWGQYAQAVTLWEQHHGPVPTPVEAAPRGGIRLAAALPEWMMGLPAGILTAELPRRDALRLAGNGVMPHQAATAWGLLAP